MTAGTQTGDIGRFLAADHARLDGLLERATGAPGDIDPGPYAEFRSGLLRHIAIEEKLLLPAAEAARHGEPLPVAARLRRDHGAVAALLVPSPTRAIVATLRQILLRHNLVEEGPEGLYAACDALLHDRAALLAEMENYPDVRVSPHNDDAGVMPAVERALARAGYSLVSPH
jgi:hypothetical protein